MAESRGIHLRLGRVVFSICRPISDLYEPAIQAYNLTRPNPLTLLKHWHPYSPHPIQRDSPNFLQHRHEPNGLYRAENEDGLCWMLMRGLELDRLRSVPW
jgi:hypothetical protein